jgi:hypothetical protein
MLVVGLFAVAFGVVAVWVQPWLMLRPERLRVFGGVKLSKSASALLNTVEHRFGQPIQLQERAELEPGMLAHGGVDPQGAPVIVLSDAVGRDEGTIVHELFHLELMTEGYPTRVTWDLTSLPGGDTDQYDSMERSWEIGVLTPLTHRVFYPKMREMKLDPSAQLRTFFSNFLRDNRAVQWNPDVRVLTYFHVALELSDSPGLVDAMERFYVVSGWENELTIAKEMAAIAISADLSDGSRLVTAFVDCMNRFLTGLVNVQFSGFSAIARRPPLVSAAFSVVRAAPCVGSNCPAQLRVGQ